MTGASGSKGTIPLPAIGRLVTLLCVLAVVGLWLQHHLGFQFANLGIIAGGALVVGVVAKIVEKLVEKRSLAFTVDRVLRPVRNFALGVSEPAPLGIICVLLAVPMTILTSVTVAPEQSASEPNAVSIKAVGSGDSSFQQPLRDDSTLVRFFPVFTNPFGRLFQVRANGYLTTTVVLYPLSGRNVVLGRDLAPAPSVLFRPFVEGTSALSDGGVFRVSRITSSGPELIAADTGRAVSFRLGPSRPLTSSILEFWRLQLDAFQASTGERARAVLRWQTPRQLTWSGVLSPGDTVLAEILRKGTVMARARVAIGTDPLVDVLVMDLPPALTVAVTTNP